MVQVQVWETGADPPLYTRHWKDILCDAAVFASAAAAMMAVSAVTFKKTNHCSRAAS
jgi:hypothetical protein